ncbi:MAG: DUF1850 domain-containing protein [Desulfurococcales archaeon]|nr:DUF1850 domain-containing protein [Desulfurococcales archaeon]
MMRDQVLFTVIMLLLVALSVMSVQGVNQLNNRYELIVYCQSGNIVKELFVLELDSPTIANLSFIHSVHKTPIYDILLINSTGFYGIQHWTMTFGAGEPDTASDAGAKEWTYNPKTGFYVFKGMSRPLGKTLYLPIDISYNMSVTIMYHGIPLKLDEKTCNHTMIIVDYSPHS